jgi:glycosyltransferase involved in cell wall biosynthesis
MPKPATTPSPRVLMVLPGPLDAPRAAIWAKRQVDSLAGEVAVVDVFGFDDRRSLRGLVRGALGLRRAAEERAANLVHVHFGSAQALAAVLASPVPVVVSYCGSDLLGNYDEAGRPTLAGRVSVLFSRVAALGARRTIAKSDELRRALRLPWIAARCTVIPNGVDLAVFRPRPRADARRALGWDDDPVALFVDNGAHVKDPALARASFEHARRRLPSLRLHVVGGVAPELMPLLYAAADVLLVTSRHEGSNNAIKEAIACDLPVVTTDCGDARERLAGVRPSFVCGRDPIELGARVAEIAAARRRSDGSNHVEPIDLRAVARRVATVYESALAGGAPKPGLAAPRPGGAPTAPVPAHEYAAALEAAGTRVVLGEHGVLWLAHERAAMMRAPTSLLEPPTDLELRRVFREGRCAVATYLLAPSDARPANAALYVARGPGHELERLSKPARRDARRALRSLEIRFIPPEVVLAKGLRAFADTRARVGLADGTEAHFRSRFEAFFAHPAHFAAGAFAGDELVAFMTLRAIDDVAEIEGSFSSDSHRAACPVDGLAHVVLDELLGRRGFTSVGYGLSSIQADGDAPGLHHFKLKVGFESIPVHRAFVFHPALRFSANQAVLRGVRVALRLRPGDRMLRKAEGVIAAALGERERRESPT